MTGSPTMFIWLLTPSRYSSGESGPHYRQTLQCALASPQADSSPAAGLQVPGIPLLSLRQSADISDDFDLSSAVALRNIARRPSNPAGDGRTDLDSPPPEP